MGYGNRWPRSLDTANEILGAIGGSERAQLVIAGARSRCSAQPAATWPTLKQTLNTTKPGSSVE